MHKDKSEQLKEILNKTLSFEDIEKKLKKEIKVANIKKNIESTDARKGKNNSSNINIILYLLSIITIILLCVIVYLFIQKNSTKEENSSHISNKELILQNNIKELKQKEALLSKNIQDKKEILKKQSKEIKLKTNLTFIKDNMLKVKQKEEPKNITKITKLDRKSFKSYYNSTKHNTLTCYNFKSGNIFPTKSCQRSINKFFKENKDAIRFEIIPVLAKDDNIIFNKLKSNIKNLDNSFKEKVKEYMNRGLSRERVLETTWYIVDTFGKDIILTPTNYYVKSLKNNKGVIIKAYH